MQDKTKNSLALAGLLHDIGKFAQRAGEQVTAEWSDGKTQQDFKYQHALHTWHFINKYVPKDFGIGVLAAYHHRPKDAAQRRIRLADLLTAGERDSGDKDDSDRKRHPKQLHPIFTRIRAEGKEHPVPNLYLPLRELSLEKEVLFPTETPIGKDDWQDYEKMWHAFCQEAESLKSLPLGAYVEAMQALLQRYTWCVPSAYFDSVPDVSLYDHSRMTAALAVCLSDFDDASVDSLYAAWQRKNGDLWDSPIALLVGGDLSGVQNFIYTISSKGAAKALRGRSFYLQLLTEAALRFVLRELGLPTTNIIYSGGGHFFLLAPLSAKEKLPEIQAAISRKMLTHHSTALYLALGYAETPLSGFQLGAFTDHWEAMHKALQQAKSHRYAELGEEMYEQVFAVPRDGGGDKHCAVCGADDVHLRPWMDERDSDDAEALMICDQCRSYVESLGADLPKAAYLRWRWSEPQDTSRSAYDAALKAFGAEAKIVKTGEQVATAPGDTLWALDDPANGWAQGSESAARWLRYTVNQIPVVENQAEADLINKRLSVSERKEEPARPGNTKTFAHLQALSGGESGGFKRLGVIRMDVDNLGDVFKNGFKRKKKDGSEENIATLSRLSALSSAMSLYFEGWVKRIIAKDGRDARVYAVYAGGDDVFLLGPWDAMPEVALDIEREFEAYTRHPGLHLSGGMAFIHGKYPVYQAADDAGHAEDLAKGQEGKNAFAFLNTAWRWNEFENLKEKQEKLVRLVRKDRDEAGGSPKSILMLLRSLAKMESEAARGQERPVWGRWMWMAAYHLTRAADRNETKNPALQGELLNMRDRFEQNHYRDLPQWGAAARWAQLLLRKGK